MGGKKLMVRLGLGVMLLLVVACEGYSETGSRSSDSQTMSGGELKVSIRKANGKTTRVIETGSPSGLILMTDVTLMVAKGSYKIELLGEDDQVTLTLEVRDGQAIQASGLMVTDSFGEARYRVTAVEAEDIEYTIAYTFQ